jgi:L,D-transpeptidase YcbB
MLYGMAMRIGFFSWQRRDGVGQVARLLVALVVGMCAVAASGGLAAVRGSEDPTQATQNAPSADLQKLVASGKLEDLRWPDFSDFANEVKEFYQKGNYAPAWVRGGRPTPQAQTMIGILEAADSKGLRAEDYDGGRWSARANQLNNDENVARFDLALTVSAMRYISDLHVGRVNPQQIFLQLTVKKSEYDLAQFLRDRIANGDDLRGALAEIEPPFAGYKRTLAALDRYEELAKQDEGGTLPASSKSIDRGSHYAGVPQIEKRLQLTGDLPKDATLAKGDLYDGALVEAVKRFQARHGLAADGRIGAQTLKELNVPLNKRVEQLRLTLERWRWLPSQFPQPPVVVNIPEFRLRTYDGNGKVVLSMNVIVGKAYQHQTPVFDKDMQYVVFRPYWNVPSSIEAAEIVPAVQRDRGYIGRKNYEVVTGDGKIVTSGTVSDAVLAQMRSGQLAVRQKPGATNALGLVKFMFPNVFNVYLHSTPSQQLFAQTRRDFSHGCIRVEKPDVLAAWILQGQPEWNLEKIRAAMQSGKDDNRVDLPRPIPVLILYGTAVAPEDGSAHFYDDIYGYDADLEKRLAKGYPYHRGKP